MKYALLAVAGLLACATAATVLGTQPSGDEILFPHSRHVAAKVECVACHESIYDAKTLQGGDFLPKEAKCLECHKEWKATNQCQKCHADVQHAATWVKREPHLNFDHSAHIERTKEDCSVCHSKLSEPRHASPISNGHAGCLTCHEHAQQYEDAKCNTCHTDLKKYPLVPLTQVSHSGDFLRRHAQVARASTQSCSTCHEQNFCLDCHAKTAMVQPQRLLIDRPDRRFIHQGDFLGRHSVEARGDPASCRSCHATSSCENCHQREGVSAGSGGRNPHPNGWVLPGSGSFHGDAARRDIQSCASCHDRGASSNCVECHKVGGSGGNPHPPEYRQHHTLSEAATDGRCVACHR